MATIKKPCPFCQNDSDPSTDTGGACCFCDYEGVVTIGPTGMFANLEQYNKVYYAKGHQDRLNELHGRKELSRNTIL